MKSKKITRLLPMILISIIAIFLVLQLIPVSYHKSSTVGVFMTKHPLPPIDPYLSKDLPQWKYQKLSDSLKWDRQMQNGRLSHSGIRSLQLGSLTFSHEENGKQMNDSIEYVWVLRWWKLKKDNDFPKQARYFVKNKQSYLRSRVCKPSSDKNSGREYMNCEEIDKKVPFRYDVTEDAMVIPVSTALFNLLKWLNYLFISALIIFVLYFTLLTFIKFLRDIAYGDPFSKVNVNRLKKIAISILVVPAIELFLTLIVRLIYADHFTTDIELDPEIWSIFIKPVIISLIFVALHIAFKKGQELQEEANLTV